MHAVVPDTIVAVATPPGESAMAVIRCSGPRCADIARAYIGPSRAIRPRHASLVTCRHALSGRILDTALLTFFQGPSSFTGEDVVEISSHGNMLIVNNLIDDLLLRGCRLAGPGEFSRRAFMNGRMDLSQAEAVMDLIRAGSDAALDVAHRQLGGELGMRIRKLVEALIRLLAEVEARIDFPEEGIPPEDAHRLTQSLDALIRDAGALSATARYGTLVRQGVRIALAGLPNAGKSSLLNRLCGEARAIVDPEPGTTRDFIEASFPVGAYRVVLVDTAGLRLAASSVEAQGIERSEQQIAQADLVWWVGDLSGCESGYLEIPRDRPLLTQASSEGRLWYLLNKADVSAPHSPTPTGSYAPTFLVSAKTGAGCEAILAALETWIASFQPTGETAVVVGLRHQESLREALQALQRARERFVGLGEADVLVASDLHVALEFLGAITGRVDKEEILDVLFASFCIGK
jgi:tRNA modification GTPase